MKNTLITLMSLLIVNCTHADKKPNQWGSWSLLNTTPYQGKQDDIFFINSTTGWYINGKGYIYKTIDSGLTWQEVLHQPGTYFRTIAFSDENIGFAGNLGPDYFPNVSDSTPLYKTIDGGTSWQPVKQLLAKDIKGICAIDIKKTNYIDAGILKSRTSIYAAGRVGGPAKLVISKDNGNSWKKYDLTEQAAMIQDVKFINESTGFICAGTNPDVEKSKALILKTTDGGTSWKVVYRSQRTFELVWKCDFPSDSTGYATILNYDAKSSEKWVAKTTDGGNTWKELPLANDASIKEFGVGFIDNNKGWVGTAKGLWSTDDGGAHWQHIEVGHAINKIRVLKEKDDFFVYGIGQEVLKLNPK